MDVRLYGFWRSIASFRVRVALRLKEIAFDETSVDILSGEQFGADYDRLNVAHALPTLIHHGHTLTQSLAIIEYLEEVQPLPPLFPSDAIGRSKARTLAQVAVADSHPLIVPRVRRHLTEAFGADQAQVHDWGQHWTEQGLATYERILAAAPPAPYALGNTPGVADICIAGQLVMAANFGVDTEAFPVTHRLGQQCFALPAFSQSRLSPPATPNQA